jgi:hypothetical protein
MAKLNGFAEACYDMNTVADLEVALTQRQADKTDCETWKITATQWRAAIAEALDAKTAESSARSNEKD